MVTFRAFLGGAISLASVWIGAERASTATTQRFCANMERIRDHIASSFDLFIDAKNDRKSRSVAALKVWNKVDH